MFIRNETFSSYIRNYPVVSSIVALTVAIHFLIILMPSGFIWRDLGVGWNAGIANGQYWRLVTPIFLHGSLFHLLFNMFALIIFAPALETMIGKFKFLLIYLIPGILANVVTFYLQDLYYLHVGASGSIFGVFGVFLFMYLYRNDLLDRQSAQTIFPIIVISLVMTFLGSNINILAHLFGLAFGALLAPLFLRGATPYYRQGNVRRTRKVYIDDDNVSFNPNRWKNSRRNKVVKRIAIVVGAIILLAILYARFSATYY
ncbi:rhomboid family intramembrane serine protease [Shouchella patagoniensis]|uniref:rhomboid family intramembrane serine protease n=1 Tax=Shouchella patagoniensis TaxID=228576 RepID=UPI0009949DC8|nr:rhomboid family intramembrane serine protease [Shouchella patagoniensis]